MEWTRSDIIHAPVETVWDLTVDVERWPAILPTVSAVTRLDSGGFTTGSMARVEQPGLTAEWTVETLDPKRRFTWFTQWRGRTLTAEHLVERVEAGTRNTLRLELDGERSPLVGAAFGPLMRMTLAREGRAFRRAAEAAARSSDIR